MNKRHLLSKNFKVACLIYEGNIHGEKMHFATILQKAQKTGIINRTAIQRAIIELQKNEVITVTYGQSAKGRPVRLLQISEKAKDFVKSLYENTWVEKS